MNGFILPTAGIADVATGKRGAVATVQPLATEAGIAALEAGGNAVDAAVAAALTLGVVDNHNSGLGGGCFIVIRTADGKLIAIDGRETAPAKATCDMFVEAGKRLGKPATTLSTTGPLAVGTPGALAAYDKAIRTHGKLKLAALLRPAADIAEKGFAIDRRYASTLKSSASRLQKFEGSRKTLLKPDGSPYAEGEILKQPDLAKTYRNIAEHGTDWFYRGEFSARVGQWMANNGGILSAADFSMYEAKSRKPIVSTYRGYTIVGMPPPSSGGIHVAQMLNILETFDLKTIHQKDPAESMHIVAEAMKLAFADRAYWLGDSDYVNVPSGLISKEYGKQLAKRIRLDKATTVPVHGNPPGAEREFFGLPTHGVAPSKNRHTTHISAVDAEGNWVAITATVNTSFGSKVIVPGTGVPLNNEMDDFSVAPGVPNVFGLIGAEANAVSAGKRPLSSMSPTIVLKDGDPILTVGAAGGPKIITQVLLAIVRTIDYEMPLEKAIAAPRFHHQWVPDQLLFEDAFPPALPWAMAKRGHRVIGGSSGGVSQAIMRLHQGNSFKAVSDPRVPGKAAGW